ncbi:MAG: hypothetical protein L0177_12035, partial [Chloroflexi bacterium]|nr:hypothetical protein [Chloroflexota bacterium]
LRLLIEVIATLGEHAALLEELRAASLHGIGQTAFLRQRLDTMVNGHRPFNGVPKFQLVHCVCGQEYTSSWESCPLCRRDTLENCRVVDGNAPPCETMMGWRPQTISEEE